MFKSFEQFVKGDRATASTQLTGARISTDESARLRRARIAQGLYIDPGENSKHSVLHGAAGTSPRMFERPSASGENAIAVVAQESNDEHDGLSLSDSPQSHLRSGFEGIMQPPQPATTPPQNRKDTFTGHFQPQAPNYNDNLLVSVETNSYPPTTSGGLSDDGMSVHASRPKSPVREIDLQQASPSGIFRSGHPDTMASSRISRSKNHLLPYMRGSENRHRSTRSVTLESAKSRPVMDSSAEQALKSFTGFHHTRKTELGNHSNPLASSIESAFLRAEDLPSRKLTISERTMDFTIDYDTHELYSKPFAELLEEDLDIDPGKRRTQRKHGSESELVNETRSMMNGQDLVAQSEFFESLNLQEWKRVGTWICEQESAIKNDIIESRKRRREIYKDFESKISTRYDAVCTRQENLSKSLHDMKTRGEYIVKLKGFDKV